jgi:hypothetical protein
MARAEERPEERDLPDPGDHSARGHQTDDQADLEEEHQLQRSPPLYLLPLLYLELHAARVPARFTPCNSEQLFFKFASDEKRETFGECEKTREKRTSEDENICARVTLREMRNTEIEKFGKSLENSRAGLTQLLDVNGNVQNVKKCYFTFV